MRALVLVAALLAALAAHALAAGALACAVTPGQRVLLAADALDPNVFVWDATDRLIEYAAGDWKNAASVVHHSTLSRPGTRAVIVGCKPGVVHSKFSMGERDAVGVRLVSGPQRGRYGWVSSEDVHPLRSDGR